MKKDEWNKKNKKKIDWLCSYGDAVLDNFTRKKAMRLILLLE